MKFLIDACVPRLVTELLREAGHDATETREGGPDPGDVAILARAVSERRVLVTMDSDFATLALRHGAAHHGVIQLPDASIESLRRLLQRLLAAHPGDELASAVVIAKGGSVRIFRVIRGGSG